MRAVLALGALAAIATLAACAPRGTASSGFHAVDADTQGEGDAPLPCGTQPGLVCGPTQYCQVGCTGEGPVFCAALTDAGVCPPGYAKGVGCSAETATPCEANSVSQPTMCFDDPDAATCPGPPEGRTFYCNCPL
jgi:hypothetical protein